MFLLPHLATVHNFSRRFLHLLQLRNEIPEPGLGNNMVRSKDPHAIERRGPALRRGQASTDHLVLPELEEDERQAARSVSAAELPPLPPDPASPRSGPGEGTAARAGQPRGREKPPAKSCAARRPRPPHRGGAASSRVLRERRRRRHVGCSPPQGPSRAAWARRGRFQAPQARAAVLPTATSTPVVSVPAPAVLPAPQPSLTVPDAFMVLPPPRPAGKERPRAPPPPVTRPPEAPPPDALSAHWLGGERDWRRQLSVSSRGGRSWLLGRVAWSGPAAVSARRQPAVPRAPLLSTVTADLRGPGAGRKRPHCTWIRLPPGLFALPWETWQGSPRRRQEPPGSPRGCSRAWRAARGTFCPVFPWETGAAGCPGAAPVDHPHTRFDGTLFFTSGPQYLRSCGP